MEDIEHTLTNCAHKLDMATVVAHMTNNESDSEGCSSASSSSSGWFDKHSYYLEILVER